MSIHRVTTTEITGLSASGAVDNTGSWNTSVDLDSFVTVPSGATAAVISCELSGATARWAGLRTAGKTTAIGHFDQAGNSLWTAIVPLGTGNTIDVYAENVTSTKFYITGFCSSNWTFYDIDGTLPEFASTGSVSTLVTAPSASPSIPANATLVMLDFYERWRPTAESVDIIIGTAAAARPNSAFIKLDSSSQVRIYTSAATKILGFVSTGVNWNAWQAAAELTDGSTLTEGAWTTGPTTMASKSFCYIANGNNTFDSADGFAVRGSGDTVPSISAVNSGGFGKLVPLNSGQYEYYAESTVHVPYYIHATFDAASSGSSSIINKLAGPFGGPLRKLI